MSPRAPKPVAVPGGGFRDIAVLRLSSLGDVILTLPVVQALRAAFPSARITYWIKEEFADAVRFDPALSHVRVLERDARRLEDLVSMSAELEACDLIVDLHANARTRLLAFRQRAPVLRVRTHRIARARWVHARWSAPPRLPGALARYASALAPIGLEAADVPRVAAGEEAEAWADAQLSAWGWGEAPLVLCPAAQHATKRWPERHWLALDEALAAAGRARLYFSLARERASFPALAARIEREPRARWISEPLPRIAALMSRGAAAVAGDTGLMHLAAARGLRVVALFGSTSPVLGFAPAGEGHVVLCRDEPCQPCTLHGRETCPLGHFRCMIGIEPGAVLAALETIATRAAGAGA